jgi:hypothetical protein
MKIKKVKKVKIKGGDKNKSSDGINPKHLFIYKGGFY